MSWKIYHNPRCSKSRQTLQLLKDNNVEPEVIEYLKTPPTKNELESLVEGLGSPELLVRTKEDDYKSHPFDTSSADSVVKGLVKAPKLMERPVVVHGKQVVLGRPPENVLELLKKS